MNKSNTHLLASSIALSILAICLVAGVAYAQSVEKEYIYALAPMRFTQKYIGLALPREALEHSTLLPFYASSEIDIPDPYQLDTIFKSYPTGFTVFPLGSPGAEALSFLQWLGAAGGDLRGKKVVISLSPQFFTWNYRTQDYAANFSRMDAYETVFSSEFSLPLKQRIARRMLDYPQTLKSDFLLAFALQALASRSFPGDWEYYAVLPLGRLQVLMFELQDHQATVEYILNHKHLKPVVTSRPAPIDWQALQLAADQSYRDRSNNNPFGFDNKRWEQAGTQWLNAKDSMTDKKFIQETNNSAGWGDLELMLDVLRQAGADPLILCMPLPGKYMDYLGISATARQVYYDRFRQVMQAYGMPANNFEAYDEDPYLQWDPYGHLTSRGWVLYAQVIDAFYHGEPLPGAMSK